MSCSQVRRELLEHFAFREELGPRSGPHLAHLDSCADCRREVGIDRALVKDLRRALRDRVEGRAPSAASWELVRRRTVDRPARTWIARVPQWSGLLSAAAAGIMVFAVATAQESLLPSTQSPRFVVSPTSRAVAPIEEAGGWLLGTSTAYRAPQEDGPPPGWPRAMHVAEEVATNSGEPPITGRMR